MAKVNKWVSSLAAGFIAVAGLVGAGTGPAQAHNNLTPGQADKLLDSYHQVLNQTLNDVVMEESRLLRPLVAGDVCYTVYNALNPTALPNTPFALEGTFFVPAIIKMGGQLESSYGQSYRLEGDKFFETAQDFLNSGRQWRTDDIIGVGCFDHQEDALAYGQMLNEELAHGFIQNGINKLSAALKRGQAGPAPQP